MAYCLGSLGEFLLWHGDIDEAQENLEAALVLGERTSRPAMPVIAFAISV